MSIPVIWVITALRQWNICQRQSTVRTKETQPRYHSYKWCGTNFSDHSQTLSMTIIAVFSDAKYLSL